VWRLTSLRRGAFGLWAVFAALRLRPPLRVSARFSSSHHTSHVTGPKGPTTRHFFAPERENLFPTKPVKIPVIGGGFDAETFV
jgi:hypothetical protein